VWIKGDFVMSVFDEDLKSMLGGMYQDDTDPAPKQMPTLEQKVEARKAAAPKVEEKPAETVDVFVPVKKRDEVDKAIDVLKWLIVCGSISMLMWWFWQNNLMAMEAAYPCILASAMVGTGGVVWSVK
jgi:hypothetical protein